MKINEKRFATNKGTCKVELFKEGSNYIVKVDNELYKITPNELFAVECFTSI